MSLAPGLPASRTHMGSHMYLHKRAAKHTLRVSQMPLHSKVMMAAKNGILSPAPASGKPLINSLAWALQCRGAQLKSKAPYI